MTLKQSQLFCRLVIVIQALGVGRPVLATGRHMSNNSLAVKALVGPEVMVSTEHSALCSGQGIHSTPWDELKYKTGLPGGLVAKNPLAKEETWVRSLVQGESHMPQSNKKPVGHLPWACTLWAQEPQLLSLCSLDPMLCNRRNQWNEKPTHRD